MFIVWLRFVNHLLNYYLLNNVFILLLMYSQVVQRHDEGEMGTYACVSKL